MKTAIFMKKTLCDETSMFLKLVKCTAINHINRTVAYCDINLDWPYGKIKSKIRNNFCDNC